MQVTNPEETFPVGCSSGNVSGTPDDLARCVVVRISLGSNGLTGGLSHSSILKLPYLAEIDISDNALEGDLPEALSELSFLRELDLDTNTFTYSTSDPTYAVLFDCHRIGGERCGPLVRGAWCVVRGARCAVRGAWCVGISRPVLQCIPAPS